MTTTTTTPTPEARGVRGTVLVVFHEEVVGGATLSVLRVIPELEERGWRFSFWVSAPSELHEELVRRGWDVHGRPRHVSYSLSALRLAPGPRRRLASLGPYILGLQRAIKQTHADLVHANALFTVAEAMVARACRRPVVLHVHEMVPETRKGSVARWLANRVATELVAVSRSSAAALQRGDRAPRIVYESAPIPPRRLRREIAPRSTVVGTVGVIARRKGSDLFVEAARLVRERSDDIRFHMVGAPTDPLDADWAKDVLQRAAEIGVAHTPRANVFECLRQWDLFVLPSRRDPFPISMLEAMGGGLPVIGADVDGIAEQLADGAGVLVEPESSQALADAILELHAAPERREALGDAARDRIVARHDPVRQADGLHAAYLAALASGGARTGESR